MGAINENSVRQQIIRLDVNEDAVFPIDRADYVASMAHRIAKRYKRKYTCPTTDTQIRVTRIQ